MPETVYYKKSSFSMELTFQWGTQIITENNLKIKQVDVSWVRISDKGRAMGENEAG